MLLWRFSLIITYYQQRVVKKSHRLMRGQLIIKCLLQNIPKPLRLQTRFFHIKSLLYKVIAGFNTTTYRFQRIDVQGLLATRSFVGFELQAPSFHYNSINYKGAGNKCPNLFWNLGHPFFIRHSKLTTTAWKIETPVSSRSLNMAGTFTIYLRTPYLPCIIRSHYDIPYQMCDCRVLSIYIVANSKHSWVKKP